MTCSPTEYELEPFCQASPQDCYPTCVSIATGISRSYLCDLMGHDGQRNSKPYGYAESEMRLALLRLGWVHISLDARIVDHEGEPFDTYPDAIYLVEKMFDFGFHPLLIVQRGVEPASEYIMHHCLVWSGYKEWWFDPHTGEEPDFDLWALKTIEGVKKL